MRQPTSLPPPDNGAVRGMCLGLLFCIPFWVCLLLLLLCLR